MAVPQQPNEDNIRYEGWRVALASSVGVFVSFASVVVYTFSIFLKPLASEFSWSREAISAAFGLAAIMVAVCSPLLGLLFDRFGPSRIIIPCVMVLGCAFSSLSFLTPPIWHLYAIFIVLGIVGNGSAHMAYARAVSTWFDRRRGVALAMVMAGGAIGAMVLPSIAQSLIEHLQWRGAAIALGCMILLLGLPTTGIFVRERPGSRSVSLSGAPGSSVSQALQSRAFWLIVSMLFFASLGQNGAITHFSALLTDRGISPRASAIALSSMGAAVLVGRILTGWLLDRFFAPRVGFVLLTLAAVGTFLLSNAHSLSAGIAAAVLIGFGMGGEADITPFLLAKYYSFRSLSTLYGFTWTAYALAGAIGPILMGKAFDATGSYQAFLLWLAVLTVGAATLMLFMPSYDVGGTPTPMPAESGAVSST
jgi:predicted MFS family arabinose efflux permease